MHTTLFSVGDFPVTVFIAGLAAIGLIVVLLVGAAIIVSRLVGDSRLAAANAESARANYIQLLADRDRRLQQAEVDLDRQREANGQLRADNAALQARIEEQARSARENLERFQGARQQMTDEFKAIAGDVLKSHGEQFTKQNREQVDTLLKPLHDKIIEFHSGLLKDRAAMGESIQALVRSNLQITEEANNLTRALKGNAQTQGAWGEMILETILERSGLREGEQYVRQQTHTVETGQRLRTDVEVLMPNDDRLIVDSKVSLVAFEAWSSTADDEHVRARHLQDHVTSVRTHIRSLGEKNYQRHAGSGLDYVMLFIPIESALSAALSGDPKLIEYGIERGVMLTTPTTLMTVLRTVRNVWDIEKRHQNAEDIAERAGALYDKVVGFVGSMDKLDQNLGRARQSFDEAKGQLTTGRGNLVRQVEMLRELGAKTSKQLPADWQDNSGEQDADATGSAPSRLAQWDDTDPDPQESDEPAPEEKIRLVEDRKVSGGLF